MSAIISAFIFAASVAFLSVPIPTSTVAIIGDDGKYYHPEGLKDCARDVICSYTRV